MTLLFPCSTIFPYTTLFRSQVGGDPVEFHEQHPDEGGPFGDLLGDSQRLLHREAVGGLDRKSTRLNSSHVASSYAVFCLKKNITKILNHTSNTLITYKTNNE